MDCNSIGMMKNAIKHSCLIISMSLSSIGSASADGITKAENPDCLIDRLAQACALDNLNIYVGPQSVEPGETIYIAIETSNKLGGSGTVDKITLVDEQSGKEFSAQVINGLAYLELNAPSQAGRLTFRAFSNDVKSGTTEVLVHAAKPSKFDLRLEKDKDQVFVNSSLLSDRFGNLLEDGQTARIDVLAQNTLLFSTQAQTENSRLSFRLDCDELVSDVEVSVRIRGVLSQTSIPSFLCGRGAR